MEESPVAIVYNEPVGPDGIYSEASRDVLDQVSAVEEALMNLGLATIRIAFTRNLRAFVGALEKDGVRYAFNLCEAVDENPRLAGHPAAVMDIMGISYTGSCALALGLTTDKLMAKQVLRANRMPTPGYATYDGTDLPRVKGLRFPVIVKPRFEDGSIGIDQDSIFLDKGELKHKLPALHERFGPLILEEFISGREFNVSLFGYPSPQIMPIAEIRFDDFPMEVYPIVGYRAKWDKASFEYHHTPRVFPTNLAEVLGRTIHQTALRCFRCFMLRDYARVDIRIDSSGRVYVLEINANPCISPDAGFPAAVAEGGISYDEFVRQLLGFAQNRKFTEKATDV